MRSNISVLPCSTGCLCRTDVAASFTLSLESPSCLTECLEPSLVGAFFVATELRNRAGSDRSGGRASSSFRRSSPAASLPPYGSAGRDRRLTVCDQLATGRCLSWPFPVPCPSACLTVRVLARRLRVRNNCLRFNNVIFPTERVDGACSHGNCESARRVAGTPAAAAVASSSLASLRG